MWDIDEKYMHFPDLHTDEQLTAVDEVTFTAYLRGKCLILSEQLNAQNQRDSSPRECGREIEELEHLCLLWRERGLKQDDENYAFAQKLISAAKGELPPLAVLPPFKTPSQEETDVVRKVIYDRRAVRRWKDRPVPEALVQKIIEAGIAAQKTGSRDSIRFFVIREENLPGAFKGSDIPWAPLHIVVAQDERCYLADPDLPSMDRLLDAAAASVNCLLAVYAYGLDACWDTFNPGMTESLRERLNVPDYYRIVNFLEIGYGDQTPYPPQRPRVEESVLVRI